MLEDILRRISHFVVTDDTATVVIPNLLTLLADFANEVRGIRNTISHGSYCANGTVFNDTWIEMRELHVRTENNTDQLHSCLQALEQLQERQSDMEAMQSISFEWLQKQLLEQQQDRQTEMEATQSVTFQWLQKQLEKASSVFHLSLIHI